MGKQIALIQDTKDHIVEIEGIRYRLKKTTFKQGGHRDKMIFEETNEAEYKKRISSLADTLLNETGLDAKRILVDILSQAPTEEIKKIESQMQKGAKPKLEEGCLNIKVGKANINIC